MQTHYNKKYFSWQEKAGLYGATQDRWIYEEYIKKNDSVLDFGCGGGFLLQRLDCKKKYGIDINPIARKTAEEKGITMFDSIEHLPNRSQFDVIISHHTLEHVENPATVLKSLTSHLKPKGKLVFVVPIDDWRRQKEYTSKDINKHLYTWTPLLLGNLFSVCGYRIKKIEIISTAFVPLSRYYYDYIPKPLYALMSRMWSMLTLSRQMVIVATK
jgi:SAM-dependent methyltransferase